MLGACNILPQEDVQQILGGLEQLKKLAADNALEFSSCK